MYLCHSLLPAPASLHGEALSRPHTTARKSHTGARPSLTKAQHKAERLGDCYLSRRAGQGHGQPPIARIPHHEFVLGKARLPGPQKQNKYKYRARRFIRLIHACTPIILVVQRKPARLFLFVAEVIPAVPFLRVLNF